MERGSTVEDLLGGYYAALGEGDDLTGFYASDGEAGVLAPVVKIGSGVGELFVGHEAVAAAVRRVRETFTENALHSRGPLLVRQVGDVAVFTDTVWWEGRASGKRFGSLTRWSGVCLTTVRGWRFIQLHVSEETQDDG